MTSTTKKTTHPFADYARLKDLTGGGSEVAATFEAMAGSLSGFGREATIQFRLEGDEPPRTFVVDITKAEASVRERSVERPALEIVTRHATWREIASGALSPLEAFVTGRMRVLGSTALGVELLHHLRGSGCRVDIC